MDDRLFERAEAELGGWADPAARLRQALEKDEFTLYCQPILGLSAAGGYPMAEVLVRMREEEKALLPPGDFLPVFEHYRMMPQLDRWVVGHTLQRLADGSRIPAFTVNLSAQTLADADFPRYVAAQLDSRRVPAAQLLFEINESDALTHADDAARLATAYRAIGGRVLIDGFGHRTVSFATIKTMRIDFLKIDGSITRKLLTSEVARTKMNAILRVAAALQFAIVAEQVEDQDVLMRLKALGVGYAQGFGIYQPQPIDKLAAGG